MTVTLSTLGSHGVTFEVKKPSPLYETGPGGVALQVEIPWLPDEHPWRQVSYAFSGSEALDLWEELRTVLLAGPRGDAMSLTVTVGAPTGHGVGVSESEERRVVIHLGATNVVLLLTLTGPVARELLVQLREVLGADLEL